MTRHLRDGAACAEQGAATIFTSVATLFGDAVTSTSILASLAKGVERPNRKGNGTEGLEDGDKCRHSVYIIWHAVDF